MRYLLLLLLLLNISAYAQDSTKTARFLIGPVFKASIYQSDDPESPGKYNHKEDMVGSEAGLSGLLMINTKLGIETGITYKKVKYATYETAFSVSHFFSSYYDRPIDVRILSVSIPLALVYNFDRKKNFFVSAAGNIDLASVVQKSTYPNPEETRETYNATGFGKSVSLGIGFNGSVKRITCRPQISVGYYMYNGVFEFPPPKKTNIQRTFGTVTFPVYYRF